MARDDASSRSRRVELLPPLLYGTSAGRRHAACAHRGLRPGERQQADRGAADTGGQFSATKWEIFAYKQPQITILEGYLNTLKAAGIGGTGFARAMAPP